MPHPDVHTDVEALDRRLAAVERALVDDDVALDPPARPGPSEPHASDATTHARRLDELEAAIESLQAAVGQLEQRTDRAARRTDAVLRAAALPAPSRDGPRDTGTRPDRCRPSIATDDDQEE